MKQTAVEWFAEELNKWRIKEFGEDSIIGIPSELLNQAKEMEKEQIIEAHEQGFYSSPVRTSRRKEAEEYYNETFKSE